MQTGRLVLLVLLCSSWRIKCVLSLSQEEIAKFFSERNNDILDDNKEKQFKLPFQVIQIPQILN